MCVAFLARWEDNGPTDVVFFITFVIAFIALFFSPLAVFYSVKYRYDPLTQRDIEEQGLRYQKRLSGAMRLQLFQLLLRGPAPVRVGVGRWDDHDVAAFDLRGSLWKTPPSQEAGPGSPTRRCVVMNTRMQLPTLVLERKHPGRSLVPGSVSVHPREGEALLGEAYSVRSTDDAFAFALATDPGFRGWVVRKSDRFDFKIAGPWAMICSGPRDAVSLRELLEAAREFIALIAAALPGPVPALSPTNWVQTFEMTPSDMIVGARRSQWDEIIKDRGEAQGYLGGLVGLSIGLPLLVAWVAVVSLTERVHVPLTLRIIGFAFLIPWLAAATAAAWRRGWRVWFRDSVLFNLVIGQVLLVRPAVFRRAVELAGLTRRQSKFLVVSSLCLGSALGVVTWTVAR